MEFEECTLQTEFMDQLASLLSNFAQKLKACRKKGEGEVSDRAVLLDFVGSIGV